MASKLKAESRPGVVIPRRVGAAAEINYGATPEPDFGPLARDRIPVRGMTEKDLRSIIEIDHRITGRVREEYFRSKLTEALRDSNVRVSLVAECDGIPAGFIMARVDLGEFGRVAPVAIIDTIGVDLDYRGQGVGRALLSQLLANLSTLRVERVRTELSWRELELLSFLDRCGFEPSQTLSFDRAIV